MHDNPLNEKIVEVSKTIFFYCMARTPNREEAEDLCQNILLELVKSSKSIRNEKAFYGFMWDVAGNVYKQWYRERIRVQTCELTENTPSEDSYPGEEDTDLYLLRRELSLLAERYRRATILYYIDRKPCSEISHILSVSKSMVKYLLFKSRKILKEGMIMERQLGTLSYNPKSLVPLYNGTGPNRFWDFMQSRIRQNIVLACCNDSLTPEQISLETGISLPYLEEDIHALAEKKILRRDGTHYRANIPILTSDCTRELVQSAIGYQSKMADKIGNFLEMHLADFRQIGFQGNDFSDNTLRWQLTTFVLAAIADYDAGAFDTGDRSEFPETAWGDHAYLWLVEKNDSLGNVLFNTAQVTGNKGDCIHFFDYLPCPRGDHHDFYGNRRITDIFCEIARGSSTYSEYDLEAVADMIRKGYVIIDGDTYRTTTPLFTVRQYEEAVALARTFVAAELGSDVDELNRLAANIIGEHTPRHLQSLVRGIAQADKFVHAACSPIVVLVDRNILRISWNPLEMPTIFVVLNK